MTPFDDLKGARQMATTDDFCCGTCLFFAEGDVPDRDKPGHKGKRRQYKDGFVCTIRPPLAGKAVAETFRDRVCALYCDYATREQPLRFALPESMRPTSEAEGRAEA